MAENRHYDSPRWSGEILDCSMPMTFDTYSECSYRCVYCFSFFQKSIGQSAKNYLKTPSRPVNIQHVLNIFEHPETGQFGEYVKKRLAMQWGGLSDPFDENEREQGVTLELLRYFRKIEYPISFSTKGTWWSEDERYVELFKGARHFNLKVSIITLDQDLAWKVEPLVDSPQKRLEVIRRAHTWGIGGVTLRLRPFILGVSDHTYLDLIQAAADAGADAVSTEFLCLEGRSTNKAAKRYQALAKAAGFDVFHFYKTNSYNKSGYMRLNREVKRPYIEKMQEQCAKLGLRFYVSDAHFKECSANGSCCGLDPSWNYSRGQFTEALLLAKANGRVTWSEIAPGLEYAKSVSFAFATGFNQRSSENRSKYHNFSMFDYIHYNWNNVNSLHGPYKYFAGVLLPDGRDGAGDVIYRYNAAAA